MKEVLKMTYDEFSELKSGNTITIKEYNEIFADCSSVTIKDNSVRGAATVSKNSVKIGDYVNNGTRFIKIVEDVKIEPAEPKKEITKYNNWTDSMNNYCKNIFDIVSVGQCKNYDETAATNITVLQFKDFEKACQYYEVFENEGFPAYQEFILEVLNLQSDHGYVMPGGTYYNYDITSINTDVIAISETVALNV